MLLLQNTVDQTLCIRVLRIADNVVRNTLIHDKFPVKGASVVVVHYDGENHFERFLNTDQNGKLFFSTAKKGVYMAVTRKPLAEGIEGIYDSREIASTFTCVKR